MSRRGSYRRHSAAFKLQICTDIRSGKIGRLETQKLYSPSANLIQYWLVQHDRGELAGEEVDAAQVADYEAKIAALERKVEQLTMELDLLKKMPRLHPAVNNDASLIVSGPRPAPSDEDAL